MIYVSVHNGGQAFSSAIRNVGRYGAILSSRWDHQRCAWIFDLRTDGIGSTDTLIADHLPMQEVRYRAWKKYRMTAAEIDRLRATDRLEYLRGEIEAERISSGEIAELQELAPYIDRGDILLLQWAGVQEFESEDEQD